MATKKAGGLATAGFPNSRYSRLHLDQRALGGRALRPAARTARLRLAGRVALARARQFLRLRRHRPLDIFEADLFLRPVGCRLVLDQHDADMPAALELAEQHLVGERLLDVLLDHAGHRPRTHLLVVTMLNQPRL